MMGRYKIVFKDGDNEKVIFGDVDLSDPNLVKVDTDQGNTIFINKVAIIFIKELLRDAR